MTIENLSLSKLIEQLTLAMESRCHIPISVTIEGTCKLPVDVRYALYRIAQEGLNNVVKHSRASSAEIRLECSDHHVEMTIVDDGQGFDERLTMPESIGLEVMRERAATVGATIVIESPLQQGTKISVRWSPKDEPVESA